MPIVLKADGLALGKGVLICNTLEEAREGVQSIMTVSYTHLEELSVSGAFYVATEDGSAGTKGNVLDAVREQGIEADVIYACGPKPMLRAIKAYACLLYTSRCV